jgi:hypothetical protein
VVRGKDDVFSISAPEENNNNEHVRFEHEKKKRKESIMRLGLRLSRCAKLPALVKIPYISSAHMTTHPAM